MVYGVFSANEWLYPDTVVSEGKQQIKLVAARQSYACAQILIAHPAPQITVTWQGVEGDSLSVPDVYKLHPIYVEKNTGERGFTIEQGTYADYYTRPAPFWIYDAMESVTDTTITCEDEFLALYLRWPTQNVIAGIHNGALCINDVQVPVSVNICNVTVPTTETLRLTNWYSLTNMAVYHNVEKWSEDHWNMIKKYALLMRHARQTDFTLPTDVVEARCTEQGQFIFDYTRAERYIRLFLSLGFRYIESETPIRRLAWEENTFVVGIFGEDCPALSEKAYAYLQGYYTGLYAMLKRNGWLSITTQHVADEPHAGCAAEYRILSGMMRKWMPGVPIIEAVEIPDLDGAVDIWVPKDNSYTTEMEAYERKRANGDTLWYYTCCCPGGKYLNRLLDEELLRTRYLHWANRLFDIAGYLHWGFNQYQCTNDPFKGRAGVIENLSTTALPCGDSHIVYPAGQEVWGSVRLEMMRAGCEDYELLTLLKQTKPQCYTDVMAQCVRSFLDYSAQAEVFEPAYEQLLKALS